MHVFESDRQTQRERLPIVGNTKSRMLVAALAKALAGLD